MPNVFIDSNIFLYANDHRDRTKHESARRLIDDALGRRNGFVSAQVINEFAFNAVRKLGIDPSNVLLLCDTFERLQIVPYKPEHTRTAIRIQIASKIGFWDALIVAAASSAGCETLYTEDLNPGQTIAGVKIVDPFA